VAMSLLDARMIATEACTNTAHCLSNDFFAYACWRIAVLTAPLDYSHSALVATCCL
jgi:hypothetical protein